MCEHALTRSEKSCEPTGLTCTLRRNLTRMPRTEWSTRRSGWGKVFYVAGVVTIILIYAQTCLSTEPFHPVQSFLRYLKWIISDSAVCWYATREQEMIPFAVVGSDQEYQVNGRRLLGRKTKWGTIEGKTLSPLFSDHFGTYSLFHFFLLLF